MIGRSGEALERRELKNRPKKGGSEKTQSGRWIAPLGRTKRARILPHRLESRWVRLTCFPAGGRPKRHGVSGVLEPVNGQSGGL